MLKKEYTNKGQVTLFIVLGILIVFIVSLSIYLSNQPLKQEKNLDLDSIYPFIYDCMTETAKEGVYYIGFSGGYLTTPNFSYDDDIAYYYIDNKSYLPEKEFIESELSTYMDNFLDFCLNDFKDFKDLNITSEPVNTKTTITDDNIVFDIKFPITIVKEEKTITYEDFSLTLPIRLGRIYNTASEIISLESGRSRVCLSCFDSISKKYDAKIKLFEAENNTILYVINDPNSELYNESYKFYFATKYEVEE